MNDAYSIYNPNYNTGDFPNFFHGLFPPQPPQPRILWLHVTPTTAPVTYFASWCGKCHRYKFECVCKQEPDIPALRKEDV